MTRKQVRILVALERGELTGETARLLGGLFSPAATRVRALHVGRVLIPLFYVPAGFERLDSLRRKQLAWEHQALRALDRQTTPIHEAGFGIELEVTSGSPLAEIRKRAQLWHADLILARPRQGVAGRGGLGGVAMGLLQTAPAPVLVYGNVPADYRVRTILVPVDFSPFSRRAVEWAFCLATLVRARLRLLHVVPETSSKWTPRLRRAAAEKVADERRRAERQLREFGSPGISAGLGWARCWGASRGVSPATASAPFWSCQSRAASPREKCGGGAWARPSPPHLSRKLGGIRFKTS